MVDFRSSGVSSGGLGFYKAATRLSSPASSSLDKPAGTLTSRSVAQAGLVAQKLIQGVPRELSKEYTAAQRSYAYTEALGKTDSILGAGFALIEKFTEQANPEQKKTLYEQAATLGTGYQRAVAEIIKKDDVQDSLTSNKYLIIAGLIAAALVFK